LSIAPIIKGSGNLTKVGSGTLTLSGVNTYTGSTIISAGTLALGNATNTLADTGVVNVSGGTLDIGANSDTVGAVTLTSGSITGTTGVLTGSSYAAGSGTISAILGGSAALAKTGTGTLTLSGNNTFSGGITSSGTGTLALQHGNAAGSGAINFASTQSGTGATFTLSGGINVANNIVMDAATGRNTTNSLVGSNTLSGNITINNNASNIIVFQNSAAAGTTFTIGGSTSNTLTAATFANAISFRATTDGALGVINSQINAPNATFNINNNGFWTINSTGNSWATTTLSTAGSRIRLGANDALATGARIDISSTGHVDLNGFNQTAAGLAGSNSGAQIRNDSATTDSILTLAGLTADRSFGGAITDGSDDRKVSLDMNSSGRTQTLSGSNTYTGATTVSAGTLLVNGSLGNSAVTVDSLAVIGGTGALAGSLSFAGDSFLEVVNLSDALAVGGTITFGSGFGIANLLGISWDDLNFNTPYTVLSTSQTFGETDIANFGFDNRVAVGSLGRQAYFTSGSLNVVVIPEPRAALLGGVGLLMLLRRRR
jgi:autotransporter-associated beta strand protein